MSWFCKLKIRERFVESCEKVISVEAGIDEAFDDRIKLPRGLGVKPAGDVKD